MNILKPYLTEKATGLMAQNTFVFLVSSRATKPSVAAELKAAYGVTPMAVRIVNLPARKVTFKRKAGVQGERRKAYVTLPKGQKIPGFETLQEAKQPETPAKEKK